MPCVSLPPPAPLRDPPPCSPPSPEPILPLCSLSPSEDHIVGCTLPRLWKVEPTPAPRLVGIELNPGPPDKSGPPDGAATVCSTCPPAAGCDGIRCCQTSASQPKGLTGTQRPLDDNGEMNEKKAGAGGPVNPFSVSYDIYRKTNCVDPYDENLIERDFLQYQPNDSRPVPLDWKPGVLMLSKQIPWDNNNAIKHFTSTLCFSSKCRTLTPTPAVYALLRTAPVAAQEGQRRWNDEYLVFSSLGTDTAHPPPLLTLPPGHSFNAKRIYRNGIPTECTLMEFYDLAGEKRLSRFYQFELRPSPPTRLILAMVAWLTHQLLSDAWLDWLRAEVGNIRKKRPTTTARFSRIIQVMWDTVVRFRQQLPMDHRAAITHSFEDISSYRINAAEELMEELFDRAPYVFADDFVDAFQSLSSIASSEEPRGRFSPCPDDHDACDSPQVEYAGSDQDDCITQRLIRGIISDRRGGQPLSADELESIRGTISSIGGEQRGLGAGMELYTSTNRSLWDSYALAPVIATSKSQHKLSARPASSTVRGIDTQVVEFESAAAAKGAPTTAAMEEAASGADPLAVDLTSEPDSPPPTPCKVILTDEEEVQNVLTSAVEAVAQALEEQLEDQLHASESKVMLEAAHVDSTQASSPHVVGADAKMDDNRRSSIDAAPTATNMVAPAAIIHSSVVSSTTGTLDQAIGLKVGKAHTSTRNDPL